MKTTVFLCAMLALSWGASKAHGAEDLIDPADGKVFESEQIDIEGEMKEKAMAPKASEIAPLLDESTPAEEAPKTVEVAPLQEELEKSMDGESLTEDQVDTAMAATEKVEASAPVPALRPLRVIPSFGMSNLKGNAIDFESKLNMGLSVENDVHEKFSVGGTFRYMTLDATDIGAYGTNTTFYGPTYFTYFGAGGRDLEYRHMTMEVNGKFYPFSGMRFRPYLGLGLGLNRDVMKYTSANANGYVANGQQAGSEEYTSNYLSGSAMLGTQIIFTDRIGMMGEMGYGRGFSAFSNSKGTPSASNPDQERLERIGNSIEKSSFYSAALGLIVAF